MIDRQIRVAIALAILVAVPAIARAHPGVDRARARIDEGDYEAAQAELDGAMRGVLTRDDLVLVLEARALLDHARADEAELERTLTSLASVSPSHRFDARFPPDLAERFVAVGRRLGGRLDVDVTTGAGPGGSTVEARVIRDPAGLTRQVRMRVFDPATGAWREAPPPLTAAPGRQALFYVEVLGPGGAVLAQRGTPGEPLSVGEGPAGPGTAAPDAATSAGGFPDWGYAIVIGAIVLVVAAIVAGAVYAVLNPDVTWQVSPPTRR